MTEKALKKIGRRAQNRAQNRTAILHSAIQLFGVQGFGATTVRDIIRQTNLAAGTFYNYFNSKEEVFRAVVDEVGASLRGQLRAVRNQARNFEEFIAASFRVYFTYYAKHPDIYMMLRSNQTYNGSLIAMEDHQARTGLHELRADVAGAMEAGIIPEQDVDYLTAAIGGVAFSLVAEMMQRRPVDPEKAVQFATRLFLNGMSDFERMDNTSMARDDRL